VTSRVRLTWPIALAVIGALFFAAPAPGALSYVEVDGAVAFGQQDFLVADCPGNQSVVGGGTTNLGFYGEAIINANTATDGDDADADPDDAWIGYVDNVGYEAGALPMYVNAICASGSDADALTQRTAEGFDSAGRIKIFAKCPRGTRAVGGGLTNTAAFNDAGLVETYPADGLDKPGGVPDRGWVATLDVYTGVTQSVTVTAICASEPLASKVLYRSKSTGAPQGEATPIKKRCPRGSSLLGGGFETAARYVDGHIASMGIFNATPGDNPARDAWLSDFENRFGLSGLRATNYLVCKGG
jgi:hypothetical protein